MFNKIKEIKNVGIFESFEWEDLPALKKVNLFYGYNGGGKTTLSNILHLFSKKYDEKSQLYNSLRDNEKSSSIEVSLNNKEVSFNPSNTEKNTENIYVFNEDFVSTHVYSGFKANIKKFDDTDVSLSDDTIKEIDSRIQLLENRSTKIQSVIDGYENSFNAIWENIGTKFREVIPNRNLTDKPTIYEEPTTSETVQSLSENLENKFEDFRISQNQESLKNDIKKLESVNFKKININNSDFDEVLSSSVKRKAKSFIEEKITSFQRNDDLNVNLKSWYRDNYKVLKNLKIGESIECPVCKSDITEKIYKLLDEYSNFFSDEYNNLLRIIESKSNDVINKRKSFEDNRDTYFELDIILNNYSYDEVKDVEFSDYSVLKDQLDLLEKRLNEKFEDPSKILECPKAVSNELNTYNDDIEELNKKVKSIIFHLKENEYDEESIVSSAKEIVRRLAVRKFNNLNNNDNAYLKCRKAKTLINRINNEISTLKIDKRTALAKLKEEASYVNSYLKRLGVHNFEIDIDDTSNENLRVIYSSSSQVKNTLKHSLSSGEKTTLALAYFLSKIKFEVIDNINESIGDNIFVIDDPISSLDENRIYTTAYVIWKFFETSKQLIVLSHNLTFLKFINNVIDVKASEREDFLLRKDNNKAVIERIPDKLRNYLTTYFIKLQDIQKYIHGDIDYNEAKKFIPNYIRVVLESFLSFKLGVVKHGSSRDKYRIPGLDKLIGKLTVENFYTNYKKVNGIDSTNLIDKLVEIKRVSDPQSHGSIQSIDNFTFISDSELKRIAEDSINIIKFLDDLHFDKSVN